MKKQYSKPVIIIDDFTMAQNIATNCGNAGGNKHNHADKFSCSWDIDGMTVFTDENICEYALEPDESFGDICYNNPDGGTSVFGSY